PKLVPEPSWLPSRPATPPAAPRVSSGRRRAYDGSKASATRGSFFALGGLPCKSTPDGSCIHRIHLCGFVFAEPVTFPVVLHSVGFGLEADTVPEIRRHRKVRRMSHAVRC